ncbi:Iron/ascorbate family oxidoreductase [Handroanthus impetiginosus]|uniref:Iron/ascorbate family oxidoreductase n=1 Tax=Handroanthus impetiginosus TaxID=429701 RepID=A0A2G9HXQ9_9LAMI|nr:Iron/ascorbate family oxidoreductase [Handroanthus impetiginosus]
MSIELPIFDISKPLTSSSLSSLSLACKEWGFFQITNHGIPKDLCKKMQSLSSQIFNLPSEVKLKAGPLSAVKTYTPHFIASPFYESLRVSGPDFFASAQSSSQAMLNQSNYEFRINNYIPPYFLHNQEIEGLGMHTDMSCITILYQDELGGLQVKSKEGHFMDINPQENTLIVNIGDLLQAWSNGKFRSSEHRVVLRKTTTRFSTAFFWCFEDEKVVFAPKEVVGEGNMRAYKPFVCGDYVKFRENSEKGKFEKVGFTVKDFAGI